MSGWRYTVKTCEHPSEEYGIEGGRIIKLWMKRDGREEISYERGWDKEPQSKDAQAVFALLLEKYN